MFLIHYALCKFGCIFIVVISDDKGDHEVIPMSEIEYTYSKNRLTKIMRQKQ